MLTQHYAVLQYLVPVNAHVPGFDRADRLRKSLRHADIGSQEMADYLGVSRNSVSNWINGRFVPSLAVLRAWAARTGVSLGWLVTGNPDAEDDDIRESVKADCLTGTNL